MSTFQRRTVGLTGILGALALLGGCVATGPVGYDDYPYGYGTQPSHVDIDVYSNPGYPVYPAYQNRPGYQAYPGTYPPGYGQRRGYDPRWDRNNRQAPRAVVPVPVPVPVPYPVSPPGRGHQGGGWQQPNVRPPQGVPGLPPQARPPQQQQQQQRVIRGQRIPGLPSGTAVMNDNTPPGDRP